VPAGVGAAVAGRADRVVAVEGTRLDEVRPGDWAVVNTGTPLTMPIRIAQRIADYGRPTRWDHAVICTRILGNGTVMIMEAMPTDARETAWHYQGRPHKWSTAASVQGLVPWSERAGAAALMYEGVDYSFADYQALALHALHLPAPGLRDFIEDTGHMICSQLVDRACMDAGAHLFTDKRWEGYVKPSDLGRLLGW
jgi:hypothetical protein